MSEQTLQFRVSEKQKRNYKEAAKAAGVPLSDWARTRLDAAADLLSRLRVTPEQLARHTHLRRPRDVEGEKILEEEALREIQEEIAIEEEGLAPESTGRRTMSKDEMIAFVVQEELDEHGDGDHIFGYHD